VVLSHRAMLEIEGFTKRYHRAAAAQDVSFSTVGQPPSRRRLLRP
jgi:hypothetical protein